MIDLPSRNQGVSTDGRGLVEVCTKRKKQAERQEYRFGICIKVKKPSPNPPSSLSYLLFSLFPWGLPPPLTISQDVREMARKALTQPGCRAIAVVPSWEFSFTASHYENPHWDSYLYFLYLFYLHPHPLPLLFGGSFSLGQRLLDVKRALLRNYMGRGELGGCMEKSFEI
ncbi:hypothetical protein CEXT_159911 [Caerostris extrusa]|uniref:Uncharacterized protein n=1 Tax=Caerostris extrusa TaxID=172846 RepID=A0AAV4TSE8_CAEEX|nr:hypothetical protein CEXT_159911 [Caerostris extrusa]